MKQRSHIVVCGDSFNSVSSEEEFLGTHWSELLSKEHNIPLINLALPGASTRNVVFQLLEAMTFPDPVIIFSHAASHERIELSTSEKSTIYGDLSTGKPTYTDFAVNYKEIGEKSLISLNLTTILEDTDNSTIDVFTKHFLKTSYPVWLNLNYDQWALHFAISELKRKNFNFLYLPYLLYEPGKEISYPFTLEELELYVGYKNFCNIAELTFLDYYKPLNAETKLMLDVNIKDPGYHTTPEDQKIIKEKIKNKLMYEGLLYE